MRKYSEIIEAAKRHLEYTKFVCIAVAHEVGYDAVAHHDICARISDVLGIDPRDNFQHTFCSKLELENNALYEEEFNKDQNFYKLRLKFMDEQIEYWKAKGN